MALTSLLDNPDTRRALSPFIAKVEVPAAFPCVLAPGAHPQIVGTAIEYALYAGLSALRQVVGEPRAARIGADRIEAWSPALLRSFGLGDMRTRVEHAETALRRQHSADTLAPAVARACLVLARVAAVARAELWFLSHLPSRGAAIVAQPSDDEIAELRDLYARLPFAELLGSERIVFSPTFGEGSRRVGGAVGDLIVDDLLIELKTRARCRATAKDLRQLIAYAGFANRFGIDGLAEAPRIEQVGVLFPRAGRLWTTPLRRLVTEGCEACVVEVLLARSGAPLGEAR
ncbi:MAG: hypothetical protein V4850_23705 [Myxococcota bacterium]